MFSDGWLLSVRHTETDELTGPIKEAFTRFERQRDEAGSNDEGFLLWAILDVIVDQYFDVTTAIDERLDHIEDVVFDAVVAVDPPGDLHAAAFDREVPPRASDRSARCSPSCCARTSSASATPRSRTSRTSTTTRCASSTSPNHNASCSPGCSKGSSRCSRTR